MRWFVVPSQGRRVLGGYGSALEQEASSCAKRVELQAGLAAWVEAFEGERPSIGDELPALEGGTS